MILYQVPFLHKICRSLAGLLVFLQVHTGLLVFLQVHTGADISGCMVTLKEFCFEGARSAVCA
jgi:hypothetical protein